MRGQPDFYEKILKSVGTKALKSSFIHRYIKGLYFAIILILIRIGVKFSWVHGRMQIDFRNRSGCRKTKQRINLMFSGASPRAWMPSEEVNRKYSEFL